DARALQQPGRFLLEGRRRLGSAPLYMVCGEGGGCLHRRFVLSDNGEEIAIAHELDRSACGAPGCRLVKSDQARAAIRLAHDSRMRHAIEPHVMDKDRRAEELGGKNEPRGVAADGL